MTPLPDPPVARERFSWAGLAGFLAAIWALAALGLWVKDVEREALAERCHAVAPSSERAALPCQDTLLTILDRSHPAAQCPVGSSMEWLGNAVLCRCPTVPGARR